MSWRPINAFLIKEKELYEAAFFCKGFDYIIVLFYRGLQHAEIK